MGRLDRDGGGGGAQRLDRIFREISGRHKLLEELELCGQTLGEGGRGRVEWFKEKAGEILPYKMMRARLLGRHAA